MKKIILVLLLILTSISYTQIKNETVLKLRYDNLPIEKQIENSGIYCISHFDVEKDKIQCIVSRGFGESEIAFGETQNPQLWDYADGVNTLDFLAKI